MNAQRDEAPEVKRRRDSKVEVRESSSVGAGKGKEIVKGEGTT